MEIINRFQSSFLEYLKNQKFEKTPQELYNPINYIMEMGGKRLRPMLVLLGQYLFDEDIAKSMPLAYCVEMFHNFSLVHDDIMDQASIRRNQPTVHAKFGLNAGILSGDVMLVYVYDYISKIEDATVLPKLLQCFNKVAVQVCEGQQMDMNFEQQDEVALNDYITMIELKTSVLIAASLQLGAINGHAPVKDQKHLYEFGRSMGIAFQIQDDLLDIYGNAEKFGKQVGGDIIQNKKTYLVSKALEIAPAQIRKKLKALYTTPGLDPQEKIENVLSIFDVLNIQTLVGIEKSRFQNDALSHLNAVNASKEKKLLLEQLAFSLLDRES